jgi:hypothetical protein
MSAREVLHQMRPFPPVWTRPMDDRPPYGIWPVAATGVVTVICTLLHPTHPDIWVFFGGWCVGVTGASVTHYIYRR